MTRGCADYFTRRFSSVFTICAELVRFEIYDSQLYTQLNKIRALYTCCGKSTQTERVPTYMRTNGARATPRVEWNRKRKTLKNPPRAGVLACALRSIVVGTPWIIKECLRATGKAYMCKRHCGQKHRLAAAAAGVLWNMGQFSTGKTWPEYLTSAWR